MKEFAVIEYLKTLPHLVQVSADGSSFFYYNPEGVIPEKTFPFATLVTTDLYDTASNLAREGVYNSSIRTRKYLLSPAVFSGTERVFGPWPVAEYSG